MLTEYDFEIRWVKRVGENGADSYGRRPGSWDVVGLYRLQGPDDPVGDAHAWPTAPNSYLVSRWIGDFGTYDEAVRYRDKLIAISTKRVETRPTGDKPF